MKMKERQRPRNNLGDCASYFVYCGGRRWSRAIYRLLVLAVERRENVHLKLTIINNTNIAMVSSHRTRPMDALDNYTSTAVYN